MPAIAPSGRWRATFEAGDEIKAGTSAAARVKGAFLAKARPDADFRYFSKARACFSSDKATYVLSVHGAYFDVCDTGIVLAKTGAQFARNADVVVFEGLRLVWLAEP
jgi:hypothetical protein